MKEGDEGRGGEDGPVRLELEYMQENGKNLQTVYDRIGLRQPWKAGKLLKMRCHEPRETRCGHEWIEGEDISGGLKRCLELDYCSSDPQSPSEIC